jgi:hypothetical protein
MCHRDNGRNACPCKTIDHYCTSACHPDAEIECMNARKYLESKSANRQIVISVGKTGLAKDNQ